MSRSFEIRHDLSRSSRGDRKIWLERKVGRIESRFWEENARRARRQKHWNPCIAMESPCWNDKQQLKARLVWNKVSIIGIMRIACRPLGVSSVVVSLPRSCNRGQRYETELKRKKIRRKRGVRRDEKRIEKQQAEERGRGREGSNVRWLSFILHFSRKIYFFSLSTKNVTSLTNKKRSREKKA